MAELLASSLSSSTVNNENELVSIKSAQDEPITTTTTEAIPQISSIDSSPLHSKLLHRRIVNMLEILRKPIDDPDGSSLISSNMEHKSQPITFGQLRQATISSVSSPIIEDKSITPQILIDGEKIPHKTLTKFSRDSSSDLTLKQSKTQINKERLYYSPSLEQLFEQQNVISQTKNEVPAAAEEEEQQTQKSSLTVDEILSMYYSKVNLPTNTESHLPSSTYSNATTEFYIHPSVPGWNSSQTNSQNIPPPPSLMLNEHNRNRPPPPSYSSSVTYSRRTTSIGVNLNQQLNQLLSQEHHYPVSSTSQHLLTEKSSSSSLFIPTMTNPLNNNSIRPPPPRYKSPSSNIEQSSSTLSSINDTSTSSQQLKINNNSSTGFDPEFSRLLYGKDSVKTRRRKQKRKALSDPVK